MYAPSLNLQRGIHVTPGLEHKMFQAKHVELCGKLLSLRQKLPRFAANMSVRARTYIDFVHAQQSDHARLRSPQGEAFGDGGEFFAAAQFGGAKGSRKEAAHDRHER